MVVWLVSLFYVLVLIYVSSIEFKTFYELPVNQTSTSAYSINAIQYGYSFEITIPLINYILKYNIMSIQYETKLN